jgi:hypothetical protein
MLHLTISHIVSAVGLVIDLTGVLVLGYDLLRLQRSLRSEAKERSLEIKELYDGYVPAAEWADEIKTRASRLTCRSSRDMIASGDDALSDGLNEVAEALDFIAVRIASLAKLERHRSERDEQSARASFKLSGFGLALILLGFFVQLVGIFLN